jgi:phospholipid/cholesterol/gamma-HCH transport system permease protein
MSRRSSIGLRPSGWPLGAWLLEKMARRATHVGSSAQVVGVAENYAGLIEEVRQVNRHVSQRPPAPNPILAGLSDVGHGRLGATEDIAAFLQMLDALCMSSLRALRRPRSLRLTPLTYQFYRVCWQAIPIVVLITFLIGAIIAQQGIFHFRIIRRRRPTSSTWSASWCCANAAC